MNLYLVGGFNYVSDDTTSLDVEITNNFQLKKICFITIANSNQNKIMTYYTAKYEKKYHMNVSFIYDNDTRDSFLNKVNDADIIYVIGGSTKKLLDYVKQNHLIAEIKKLIQSKVFVGISAGMNFLHQFYLADLNVYENNSTFYGFTVEEGLSFFNVMVIPHFNRNGSDYYGNNIDVIALEDGAIVHVTNSYLEVISMFNGCSAFYYDAKEKKLNYLHGIYEKKDFFAKYELSII